VGPFDNPGALREGYRKFLRARRELAAVFVDEAINARGRIL
jgi:hypothetical protein